VADFAAHGDRTAIVDATGTYTYRQLAGGARAVAAGIAEAAASASRRPPNNLSTATAQPRIAFLLPRDHRYVVGQWACWYAGGIAVPLPEGYPPAELEYFLQDAAPAVVLTSSEHAHEVAPLAAAAGVHVLQVPRLDSSSASAAAPEMTPKALVADGADTHAMLVYTSGTTSRPKGVLVSHAALRAQMGALLAAWRWQATDRIYHVLPLHHVHGIMAKLLCAAAAGATCELAPRFEPAATWAALTRPPRHPDALTLFMAVPTVYAKLLAAYHGAPAAEAARWSATLRAPDSRLRLMVSGSAALPAPIHAEWAGVTGHTLLERFGMTEFGMAISNPVDGPRLASSVGKPLPGYEARLVGEDGRVVAAGAGASGELHIRGAGMFTEYWRKPAATAAAFAPDGWFLTGDSAHMDAAGNYYIDGRLSVDIIKTGGYKVSALEVERVMLALPGVAEVAVFGVPDATYGERAVALVVAAAAAAAGTLPTPDPLLHGTRAALPHHKSPAVVRLVPAIPRNAMGKVNKKELRAAYLAGRV